MIITHPIILAAQMWNLAINLPILIGDKIPSEDDNWDFFLLLLDILQFCTAGVASSAQAGILGDLIYDHHLHVAILEHLLLPRCIMWCIFLARL